MSTIQYQESENVKKAREELEAINKTKPKFNYNINGDALYHQYKDMYERQGKAAMEDTIGRASAMTGGYGNSYAQSAGQQAYQSQLDTLNDRIPELYQLALSKYDQKLTDWESDRAAALEKLGYEAELAQAPEGLLDSLVESGIMTKDEADTYYEKYVGTDDSAAVPESPGDAGTAPEKSTPMRYQDMFSTDADWDPTKDGWGVEYYGGWGSLFGLTLDNDAEVKAPDGKTYTIENLYNKLTDEYIADGNGESKAKAKAREKVLNLQKKLKI